MDIRKALGELYQEKKRLDAVISKLEERQRGNLREISKPAQRRGRRSMSSEERVAVSQRMAGYWADRKALGSSQPQPDSQDSREGPQAEFNQADLEQVEAKQAIA